MRRRQVLQGLGAGLAGVPLLGRFGARSSHAAGSAGAAKRLAIFFSPNGTVHEHWRPTGTGTDYAIPAGSVLEPLTDWRERIIVCDGIDFVGTSNHEGGMAAMLTGQGDESSATGGMSLDQYVATELAAPTKFASLELGVLTSPWGGSNQTRMSYSGPGSFVTPDDDPANVFDRMFADVQGGDAEADRLKARRGRVVDTLVGEVGRMRSRLGKSERAKLDAHLDALAWLEQGITGGISCEAPDPMMPLSHLSNDAFPDVGRQQMDLLVMSLLCDVTRVASIQWSHTVSPVVFSWLGMSEGHHTLSHIDDGQPGRRGPVHRVRALVRRAVRLPPAAARRRARPRRGRVAARHHDRRVDQGARGRPAARLPLGALRGRGRARLLHAGALRRLRRGAAQPAARVDLPGDGPEQRHLRQPEPGPGPAGGTGMKTLATLSASLLLVACYGGMRGDPGGADGGDTTGGQDTEGGTDTEGGGTENACMDELPGRRIRRLSHDEYARTIADLLEGQSVEAELLAADVVVHGYTNNATALLVSGLLADQYRTNAEVLADAMVADLGAFLPCNPAAMGEAECAQTFIEGFGRRAFRRPLDDDEVAAFMSLYEDTAGADGFDEGIRWTLSAILQAPKFLYRTELGVKDGDVWTLTSHEIAEELSYLIVGSMPDDELAAAADEDRLTDPDEIVAQAERLLATDKASGPLLAFVDEWLGTRQLEFVPRDADVFPELTDEIRADMRKELERLVTDTYFEGGSFADLLTADFTHASPGLAAFYGLDHPGDGFIRIDAPKRGGLLTLGAIQATHALPLSSSPVHRGVLVRERLLCDELPPPPPGVVNGAPEVDPNSSTRERYAQHSQDPACAGCHELIDPIGFAFEHYDAVGRWRKNDAGHAIDDSGFIVDQDGAEFTGARELATLLAEGDVAPACFARQWSTHALGAVDEDPGFECLFDALAEGFVAADGRLDALVTLLVSAPGFRMRRDGEPPPTDEPDDEPDDDSGADDGSSSGAPPPADPDIEIEVTQTGTWDTGECNQVIVTNVSDADVTWEVALPVTGTITTSWSSVWAEQGDEWIFSGEPWNATLASGTATDFGFCVEFGA